MSYCHRETQACTVNDITLKAPPRLISSAPTAALTSSTKQEKGDSRRLTPTKNLSKKLCSEFEGAQSPSHSRLSEAMEEREGQSP